ncbi:hypothetical protein KIL84_001332 [Mauremys mutica]|uniref:Uncharacterized protein n=1 Tax=Mauremys mutica TaxID=74926 RepID=A0A9D3WYD5_9SAUR|nr:hypothetical protein KIL84_001332 [Mauremys mutica]
MKTGSQPVLFETLHRTFGGRDRVQKAYLLNSGLPSEFDLGPILYYGCVTATNRHPEALS